MSIKIRLKADLKELEQLVKRAQELKKSDYITKRTAKAVGEAVVDEMKDLISKGISPIQGQGRFPAYKAVARVNNAKKSGGRAKKRGYPYSVQKKYPSKGTRPVNLELSGEFLDSLESRPVAGAQSGYSTDIGFWDRESQKKEQGHREGANTQPKRPIIPVRGESFSRKIVTDVIDLYRTAVQSFLVRLTK